MTFFECLDNCPPALVRIFARKLHGTQMMTRKDIAWVSGLGLRTIDSMSRRATWGDDTPYGTIKRFCIACDVDPSHLKRHLDWLRRRKKASWRKKKKVVERLAAIIQQRRADAQPGAQ